MLHLFAVFYYLTHAVMTLMCYKFSVLVKPLSILYINFDKMELPEIILLLL